MKALIEIMFEEEELSFAEFAEAEQLIVATFCEYNEVWQGGETAGEITMRLGALASPNFKVWSLLFAESNNAFKNSMGVGRRFEIVA